MADTDKKGVYDNAVRLFEEEKYQDALNAFKGIRGYLDADVYIQKCGTKLLLQRQKRTSKTLTNENVINSSVIQLKQFDEEEPKPKKTGKKKKEGIISKLISAVKSENEKSNKKVEKPEKEEKQVVKESKDISSSFPFKDLTSPVAGISGKKKTKPYSKPSLELLDDSTSDADETSDDEINDIAQTIVSTLKQFGVNLSVSGFVKGPSVILYEFELGSGTPISKITSKEEEISYAMGGKKIRILAPIPGKKAIGIEVANPCRKTVSIKDVFSEITDNKKFKSSAIPMILGKTITGNVAFADVAKLPHMIVAGTTGSGKSVCINTLITTLLYEKSPEDIRLLLVDPKRVELSVYEGIPHLLAPVIVDVEKTPLALKWLNLEMERRYQMLMDQKVRNIEEYNEITSDSGLIKLPFILMIIDEYADVMAVCGKSIELSINRIAAKARAVGIHLIIATQRPSGDVVTGTLKSNLPGRVAFAVSSAVNSRIILDEPGAESLLGKGDLLFKNPDSPVLQRAQGPFISGKEINRLVRFVTENNEKPNLINL